MNTMHMYAANISLEFVEYVFHLRVKLCCFRAGWLGDFQPSVRTGSVVDKISVNT